MNILVAYDGTKEAREAVPRGRQHAKAFDGRIILAFSMVGGPEIPRQEFERAEKELQGQAITLKEEGFECETLLSRARLEPARTSSRSLKKKEPRKSSSAFSANQSRKASVRSTAQYII